MCQPLLISCTGGNEDIKWSGTNELHSDMQALMGLPWVSQFLIFSPGHTTRLPISWFFRGIHCEMKYYLVEKKMENTWE